MKIRIGLNCKLFCDAFWAFRDLGCCRWRPPNGGNAWHVRTKVTCKKALKKNLGVKFFLWCWNKVFSLQVKLFYINELSSTCRKIIFLILSSHGTQQGSMDDFLRLTTPYVVEHIATVANIQKYGVHEWLSSTWLTSLWYYPLSSVLSMLGCDFKIYADNCFNPDACAVIKSWDNYWRPADKKTLMLLNHINSNLNRFTGIVQSSLLCWSSCSRLRCRSSRCNLCLWCRTYMSKFSSPTSNLTLLLKVSVSNAAHDL